MKKSEEIKIDFFGYTNFLRSFGVSYAAAVRQKNNKANSLYKEERRWWSQR